MNHRDRKGIKAKRGKSRTLGLSFKCLHACLCSIFVFSGNDLGLGFYLHVTVLKGWMTIRLGFLNLG